MYKLTYVLVVMGREKSEILRQCKDLVPNGAVEVFGGSLLKVSPSAAPNEEGVSREGHRLRVEDVRHTAGRVSRSVQHGQRQTAETEKKNPRLF